MRCVIITAICEGGLDACYHPAENDFILCADRGWKLALDAGIEPNAVISDFDSYEGADLPVKCLMRHPVEKDDTDTMLCVKYALEQGMRDILIIGGMGGRLDHTVANLQTMLFAAKRGAKIEMRDGSNRLHMLSSPDFTEITLPRIADFTLSVFAIGGECRGVCERGVYYELTDGILTPDFPIGVSNRIVAEEAHLSIGEGNLLIVESKEPSPPQATL